MSEAAGDEKPKYTESALAARRRYDDKTYDKIIVRVPKGARDRLKEITDAAGKSMNQFIIDAIRAEIARNYEEGIIF